MAGRAGKKLPQANLAEAAKSWAKRVKGTAGRGKDELREAMDAFGGEDVPLPVDPEDEDFPVYPENWSAVQLFLRLGTQWRIGPMGGFFGLDYSSVEAVMNLCQVRKKRKVFEQIRIMEVAALPILNKKESTPHLSPRKPAVR